MKCLYVYNPISGKGQAEKYRHYIVKKLRERFGDVEVYVTKQAGELERKAAEACGKYDLLIFAGGDGSFNEVVCGIADKENRPALGYIPTGTVNDIAHSAGIKCTIRGAVKNIVNGEPRKLDVMKINDRYAMYVACCGGMTACSYKAKQSIKKHIGKIAYALEVVKDEMVFDDFPVKLSINGETLETDVLMVMIMNGKRVASSKANRDGLLDDGKVEVIVVRENPREQNKSGKIVGRFFRVIRVFTRGFRGANKNKKVYDTYRCQRLSVQTSPDVAWNFDGELGAHGNIDVTVLNKHVELIVPKKLLR